MNDEKRAAGLTVDGVRTLGYALLCVAIAATLVLFGGATGGAALAQTAQAGIDVEFYSWSGGAWKLLSAKGNVAAGSSTARVFSSFAKRAPSSPAKKAGYRFVLVGWSSWPGGSCANAPTIDAALSQRLASGRRILRLYPVFSPQRVYPKGTCKKMGLAFTLRSDGTACCTGPAKRRAAAKLRIPSTLRWKERTYAVTEVGKRAFSGQTSLASVTLGANTQVLAPSCFRGCKNLTRIDGMGSLVRVSKNAFRGCVRLKRFTCSSPALKSIGAQAFFGCRKLSSVRLSSTKLSAIGARAFSGCTSLTCFSAKSAHLKSSQLKKAGL